MDETSATTVVKKYKDFLKDWEQLSKPEEKMGQLLAYMKEMLSTDTNDSVAFGDFWDAKQRALALFKEKFIPHARKILWREYLDISDEAKKIKQILDEQSAFSFEQFELALRGLEEDIGQQQSKMEELLAIEIPLASKQIVANADRYMALQKEITFLSAMGQRVQLLRNELIHTQIRMKQKNLLFMKLKELGDRIFPKRKEQIDAISSLFEEDVQLFVHKINTTAASFLAYKEEIKALQKFAKLLGLHSSIFTRTRETLSSCWDKLKDMEVERKQAKAAESAKAHSQVEELMPDLKALEQECAAGSISLKEAEKKAEELINRVQALQLPFDIEKKWKREVIATKRSLEEKQQALAQKQKKQLQEEREMQLHLESKLASSLTDLVNQADAMDLKPLVEKWEAFVKEEKQLKINGARHLQIVHQLDAIKDHIEEKKWQVLLDSSEEGRASCMQAMLNERHKEKRKIKSRIEEYRKLVGGSSLSLEQAMLYQDIIADERVRLDGIDTLLEEIEEKLFDLEG